MSRAEWVGGLSQRDFIPGAWVSIGDHTQSGWAPGHSAKKFTEPHLCYSCRCTGEIEAGEFAFSTPSSETSGSILVFKTAKIQQVETLNRTNLIPSNTYSFRLLLNNLKTGKTEAGSHVCDETELYLQT